MVKTREDSHRVFSYMSFEYQRESSSIAFFNIEVANSLFQKINKHTVDVYKEKIKTKGFSVGQVSDEYIKENCLAGIIESTKKFIFKNFVLDFLNEKIREHFLICGLTPRLELVSMLPSGALLYKFKAYIINGIAAQEWKGVNFNSPKRKLYKDLDRQAELFIKGAQDDAAALAKSPKFDKVEFGDWVTFTSSALNTNNQPALRGFYNKFWLKLDTQNLTSQFQNNFLDKKVGDSVIVSELPCMGLPSDLLSIKGKFKVTVDSLIKAGSFSLDLFQSFFNITKDQVHEKLIEIFSFRNDMSQRRLIIEEAFRVLGSKIKFEVPRHLILRREESIMNNIRNLPDFNVYKANKNFQKYLSSLAEKQLKEEISIDFITQRDDIRVEEKNIFEYLNLYLHPRLVEFIYFKPAQEASVEVSLPVKDLFLHNVVLREKTLNYLINSLSC